MEGGRKKVPCHCCGGEGYGTVHGYSVAMTGRCLCCRGERWLDEPEDANTAAVWRSWRADRGLPDEWADDS
jgi:hypothetical protein